MSTISLAGKVALITGASGGLGQAIAERYAALGADLIVHYAHGQEAADKVVAKATGLGRRAVAVQGDLTQVADIEKLFEQAKAAFGRLDIVVATAGVELADLPVLDFTEAQFDKLFAINAKGTYFTVQAAAKHVADHGRIIYVSSSTTISPMEGMAIYGGSKTPANYLVKVLAKEIGHRGVTVNSLIPYAVEGTGMFSEPQPSRESLIQLNPQGRLATPDDVANVAEFLASDLASFVSGHMLVVTAAAQEI